MMTLEERLNGSVELELLLAKLVTATLNESLALMKREHDRAQTHKAVADNLRGQILDHYHTAARGGGARAF